MKKTFTVLFVMFILLMQESIPGSEFILEENLSYDEVIESRDSSTDINWFPETEINETEGLEEGALVQLADSNEEEQGMEIPFGAEPAVQSDEIILPEMETENEEAPTDFILEIIEEAPLLESAEPAEGSGEEDPEGHTKEDGQNTSGELSGQCGENLTWTLDSDGTLTINGTGEMADYDNGSMWPHDNRINSVFIQEGVTSIGKSMLEECTSLESISIPQTVVYIDDRAFFGCSSLSAAALPKNLTRIGEAVFQGCQALVTITIPSGVNYIGGEAFCECENLSFITLPDHISEINSNTFISCSKLKKITIPAGVIRIGSGAFVSCTGLQSIIIPSSVKTIEALAFWRCYGLESVTIQPGVEQVQDQAFCSCISLQRIEIPSSVTEILGDFVFSDCTNAAFTIYTSCGSMAMAYAKRHDFAFMTDESMPHTLPEWTILETATCRLSGRRERSCTICGKKFDEEIPATGHNPVTEAVVEATCTQTGLAGMTKCATCGEIIIPQSTVPAKGHFSDDGKVTKTATCTANGEKVFTCVRCGSQIRTETIPAKGHKEVVDKAVSATCTRNGLTAGSHCSVCNAVLKEQETIPATQHTWGDWAVIAEPTALKEGSRVHTCKVCGTKQTGTVAKLPAKLELDKTAVKVKKTKTGIVKVMTAAGDEVTAVSSDTKIAKADYQDGKIVIHAKKKAGTVNVIVKTKSGKSEKIRVTVPRVKTKKIKCKKLTISVGKKEKLQPVITPSYSDDKVTYSVKNKKIATVSKKGVVKGKKSGMTTVTIRSGKKSATVKISVVDLDTYKDIFG